MERKTRSDAAPQKKTAASSQNEGEGSRTAARKYNQETEAFVKSGKVAPAAKDAARAVNGSEAGQLKEAEEAGKSHSHGEDPALYQKGKKSS